MDFIQKQARMALGEPHSIIKAYKELSVQAFAVWVRLMLTNDNELIGRGKIAKLLGYSEGNSNVVLRELSRKNYIRIVPGPAKRNPTRINIIKRALIVGENRFIKMALFDAGEDSIKGHKIPTQLYDDLYDDSCVICANESEKRQASYKLAAAEVVRVKYQSDHEDIAQKSKKETKKLRCIARIKWTMMDSNTNGKLPSKDHEDTHKSCDDFGHKITPKRHKALRLEEDDCVKLEDLWAKNQPSRLPIYNTNSIVSNSEFSEPNSQYAESQVHRSKEDRQVTHTELSNRLIIKHKEVKYKRSKRIKDNKGNNKKEIINRKISGKLSPDWSLAKRKPSITWAPGPKQKKHMIQVLSRQEIDPERQALVEKLGSEFRRIYTRYRKEVQPSYTFIDIFPKETVYAQKAGELCIAKGITPVQLLEYWHRHKSHFQGMRYPPLSFLASPGVVDTASCRVNVDCHNQTKPQTMAEIAHSFADVGRLDPRIRPGLLSNGFDLTGISDRYLLTIQSGAKSKAKGARFFASSKMKDMIDWIADNLYCTEAV